MKRERIGEKELSRKELAPVGSDRDFDVRKRGETYSLSEVSRVSVNSAAHFSRFSNISNFCAFTDWPL